LQERRDFPGHTQNVLGAAFRPGGDRVAAVSADGSVRLWKTAPGADFNCRLLESPTSVEFAPSVRHFALGLANGTIVLFATPAPEL